ncbi:MAG TPA: hypothetical protein VJB69_01575 [Candidatus Paceibacterota bacterium]
MFQDFLLKRLLKSQGFPEAQIELVLGAMKKNPELFKKIAGEVEKKVKDGMDKQAAAMAVMQAHQSELAQLMVE